MAGGRRLWQNRPPASDLEPLRDRLSRLGEFLEHAAVMLADGSIGAVCNPAKPFRAEIDNANRHIYVHGS